MPQDGAHEDRTRSADRGRPRGEDLSPAGLLHPGYDPFHPRRYREIYRKEGAAQARLSGYELTLTPKTMKGRYGWRATGRIDGQGAQADVEVLVWSDIVQKSMSTSIPGTYLQLVRTAWAYVGSGVLFRLMKLRGGPMVAALYPIVFLLLQLLVSCLVGWALGALVAHFTHWRRALRSLPPPWCWACAGSRRRTTGSMPGT